MLAMSSSMKLEWSSFRASRFWSELWPFERSLHAWALGETTHGLWKLQERCSRALHSGYPLDQGIAQKVQGSYQMVTRSCGAMYIGASGSTSNAS